MTRFIALAFITAVAACAHDDCETETPSRSSAVGVPLRPEASVDEFRPPLEMAQPPAPPWGDLDWHQEGDVILASLKGDERERLESRGAFVGGMLLRRTRGLGDLAVEARSSGTDARLLEISGDEIARGAALKLLQGLKESREILGFIVALESEETGETLVGPMSVSVLAGQTASISILNELAYVKDFDVEIACSAFIADPIVETLHEGIVVTLNPYADPDGRLEVDFEVVITAVQRPIKEFTTDLDGADTEVTVQLPELVTRSWRSPVVISPETEDFNLAGILVPRSDDSNEVDRARLVGRVLR